MLASGLELFAKLVSQLSYDIQTSPNGACMLKIICLDQIMGTDGDHLFTHNFEAWALTLSKHIHSESKYRLACEVLCFYEFI